MGYTNRLCGPPVISTLTNICLRNLGLERIIYYWNSCNSMKLLEAVSDFLPNWKQIGNIFAKNRKNQTQNRNGKLTEKPKNNPRPPSEMFFSLK